MKLIINNSSMQPIYLQISGQIKSMVMNGSLKEETALPSVRVLANELKISALTVKKAYDALEEEGFVVTVHGKGSFIAKTNAAVLAEEQRKATEEAFGEAIAAGRRAGLKDEELREIFEIMLEG